MWFNILNLLLILKAHYRDCFFLSSLSLIIYNNLSDKPVNRNGKKRLQKKHMVIYSSSDDCSQNDNFFWEDEYTAPNTSQNAKTDGLNILKPRNSEDKSEETKHCTIQQSSELDRQGFFFTSFISKVTWVPFFY